MSISVAVPEGPAVIDDGVQWRQADTAGDEQQVLACKVGIHRETVAVGSPDGDLLPDLHLVKPVGDASTLFDGEVRILFRWGGGDGEQSLTDTWDREHGALAGNVKERLPAVQAHHTEGLYIGGVHTDHGDFAHNGNQRVMSHFPASFSFFATLTMFIWMGHFCRQRPQPTQP